MKEIWRERVIEKEKENFKGGDHGKGQGDLEQKRGQTGLDWSIENPKERE